MMKETFKRGFTLIELLVVIAIIGILAAVVLASLNDARDSAQDTSIKQSIGNIRSQAELIYNQQGFSYEPVCEDADSIQRLMNAAADNRAETTGINVADGTASNETTVTCHDSEAGYAVVAPMNVPDPADNTQAWCVDSTGFAGTTTPGALAANEVECN